MDRPDEKFDVLNVLKSNGLPDFLWLYERIKAPHSSSIVIAFTIAEKSFDFFYKKYPQYKEFKQLKAAIKDFIKNPSKANSNNVKKYLEIVEDYPFFNKNTDRHYHQYAIINLGQMILGWNKWSERSMAEILFNVVRSTLGFNGYPKTKNIFKKHLS